jgi:DNA repair ATPase RecN
MNPDDLVPLLLGGGIGALGKTAIDAFNARANARRDDRRQQVDAVKTQADAGKTEAEAQLTLIQSAERIVALQDQQIIDLKVIITEQQGAFQNRLDAQAAALSAYETRLDREMEMRRKADVIAEDLRSQLTKLRDELADVKAAFKLAAQTQQTLREENTALKQQLFDMAVGVAALVKQATEAGLAPAYVLEVPVMAETIDRVTR